MKLNHSNRWKLLLAVIGFFVGSMITIIVFKKQANAIYSQKKQVEENIEGVTQRVEIPGIGVVDYQQLFEVVSDPGESLDEFAARIGPQLRAFSDATEFEACGVIATDGERFGVVVGTNRAHIACVNFSSKAPNGMTATNETIHSHGVDDRFVANRNDKMLQGQVFQGRVGIMSVNGQKLDNFSGMDIQSGPGYLAAPNGVVLHQAGKNGTTRVVSRVVP